MRLIIGLSVFCTLIVLSSCTKYYYVPTKHNVLEFKDKGDVVCAYGIDDSSLESYMVGYSITNSIGFISDFKSYGTNPIRAMRSDSKHDYLWDNELVLYKKIESNYFPAIQIGYGFGKFDRNIPDYFYNLHKISVQPSLGFSNDFFDFAISNKITRVHYNVIQSSEYNEYNNGSIYECYDLYELKKQHYFFEPALIFGVGYKYVKLRLQLLYVNKLSNSELIYDNKSASLSLHVRLPLR